MRKTQSLSLPVLTLPGYSQAGLEKVIATNVDLRTFFDQAPKLNRHVALIKGTVCGIRVEDTRRPANAKDPLDG